jgi:hypothetical protein
MIIEWLINCILCITVYSLLTKEDKLPFPFAANKEDYRFHGDRETWRHRDGDMETWRHRHGDIQTYRHGDMETWRHGHGILTFLQKTKNQTKNGNLDDFP